MKGLINIKNNDNKCFLWCHIRHENPLEFPVSRKGYSNIEQKNI